MKKRVLVVDDAPTVRAQLVQMLEKEFECISAENGAIGLEKALKENPDAVVADLEMPEMDGISLLRALRADKRTQTVPVVIATTVTSLDRVNECRTLGCNGFILKPVQADYLIAKLRQLMTPAKGK